MEDFVNNLTDSPFKLGAVSLSLVPLGYVLVRGVKWLATTSGSLRHPPGPPRHFLLGNLQDFPANHMYEKFCEWQRLYGVSRSCGQMR
jgi:hypothetical protein